MTVATDAKTNITAGWPLDADGWNVAMNKNLRIMSRIGIGPNAISHGLVTPPASPANGDTYIVAAVNAAGAWTNQENKVAYYDTNAWVFYAAFRGLMFYLESSQTFVVYDGSQWITALRNSPSSNVSASRFASLLTDEYRGSSGGELGAEDRRVLDFLKAKLSGAASKDVLRIANVTPNGIYHTFTGAQGRVNKEAFVASPYVLTGGTMIPDVAEIYAGRGTGIYGTLTVTNATYPTRLLICMRYQRQDISVDEDVIDVTQAAKGEVVRCTAGAINIHETNTTETVTKEVTGTLFANREKLPVDASGPQQTIAVLPADFPPTNGEVTLHIIADGADYAYPFTIPSIASNQAGALIHTEQLIDGNYWSVEWSYTLSGRQLILTTRTNEPHTYPLAFRLEYSGMATVTEHSNPGETKITDFNTNAIVNLAVLVDGSNSSAAKVTASAGNGVVSRTFGVGAVPTQIVIGGRSSIIQSLFVGTATADFDTKLLDSIALGWPVDGGAPENIINRSGSATGLTFN